MSNVPLPPRDIETIVSVVGKFKQQALREGAVTGWWGNARTHSGATGGCSWWASRVVGALEADPRIANRYEFGIVWGLRNIAAAVVLTLSGTPTVPVPLPHFVAVIWPKGTDPNISGVYIDAWQTETRYGPIRDFTFEYSWSLDCTPTIEHYTRQGEMQRIPLVKGNPWVLS
ncbi:MAG: hypothetical protein IPG96_16610 [Proteobacteria bacterium]|nr:hypothetical protein [Pseudomonadota bacterium]